MDRYQPALFNLTINRSAEMRQAVSVLSKMLPAVNLDEGELLAKREKFLAHLRSTELVLHKWSEISQSLASLLGLDGGDLTVTQLMQLSRMALLCFADDKPEPEWFDAKYFEQVQEIVSKAKQLYLEYNLIKSRLEETYSDGIYSLDLDGMIERYSGEYQSGLKFFNSTYRNDQKAIARLTNDGKVPKTIPQDLIDAAKLKSCKRRLSLLLKPSEP